jgi:hypothetical protein
MARTAFNAVGDKYLAALQATSVEEPVEKFPSTPAERPSLLVFELPGGLADEKKCAHENILPQALLAFGSYEADT